MRDAYGPALVCLGEADPRVVVLDADLGNSTRADLFEQAFPDRFVQVGIAEQNMMGIAAGLAASGLIPVVNSFAVFAVCRALDQIRTSVAQPQLPVKIVGSYSGLLASKGGSTHTAVEDIGLMRALPGITILAPGDAEETARLTMALPQIAGPVYLRLSRNAMPPLPVTRPPAHPGDPIWLADGADVALITTGTMTSRAVAAVRRLRSVGLDCTLLHMPRIKPIDPEPILRAAARCGLVITAEEHNRVGGFGAAVAEVLCEHRPTRLHRIGIDDRFGESGSDEDLLRHFGLDAESLAAAVERICRTYDRG